ncbi:MAG TPA: tetratricopeptide repeat protein [Xanthobacteraceae bacterium]
MAAPFDINQSFHEAVTLQRQGKLRDAEKVFTRVLKAAPDYFEALNQLGTVKAQLGRMGEAHRLLSAAVKINPRAAGAWANLGQVQHALKRNDEALACLDKARALDRNDLAILNQHANALLSLGRAEEALAEFQELLARAPQHAEARLNCGLAHAALGRHQQAVAEFDAALAAMPGHPGVHYNRGLALYELGRYAAALEAHDRALASAPEHAGAWLHRGRALAALNRLDEAVKSYGKARAAGKDHADIQFSEALALLTLGDYRSGFEKYESRWRRNGMPAPQSRRGPLWLGDYPLARKSVLLHAEQGLGDTIQFARYVPLLAATGAKIVLEVQSELTALLTRLDGGAAIIARGETSPSFDVHCPLGSLPLALRTEPDTVPAQIPYLSADDAWLAEWSARIGALTRPRIAIAWSGNASHYNDRNRSLAFARLAPLFAHPAAKAGGGARFISIQRDVRAEDASALAAESCVTHVGGELDNFTDTAAVIALSDLVIAADTAVAHLAGAMGRPLWVLVPFAPDWRWTLAGEASPWYPTARLFRQTALGDWDGVIARVAAELARFVSSSG